MADRELKFIYREAEPARASCLETVLSVIGIIIFFGVIMGGLFR